MACGLRATAVARPLAFAQLLAGWLREGAALQKSLAGKLLLAELLWVSVPVPGLAQEGQMSVRWEHARDGTGAAEGDTVGQRPGAPLRQQCWRQAPALRRLSMHAA
mmetsp:Transcript_68511/g.211864  ORF Transcript_68511/g.211864 Transcript_68511/m.211864 type:complete len:106 (-) Transcript_68511:2037-2354(-)